MWNDNLYLQNLVLNCCILYGGKYFSDDGIPSSSQVFNKIRVVPTFLCVVLTYYLGTYVGTKILTKVRRNGPQPRREYIIYVSISIKHIS